MTNPDFEIRRPTLVGDTADVYLQRTQTILRNEGLNPTVTIEFAPSIDGILCGMTEVKALLSRILPEAGKEVWALEEADKVGAKEVALRVTAPYGSIGLYETAICGILASCTGWATAAKKCIDAAMGIPVFSLGASNIHPHVSATLDYSAVTGGCVSCSTINGARLAGITPSGNMPHSLNLLLGSSVNALEAFDRHMPQEVPRIALVGTFEDEAEASIEVAQTMKDKLRGVRLDTPVERGGVTVEMVKEMRSRLDQAGFNHVELMITGDFDPESIGKFVESGAPVDTFGVGQYIAAASPNFFSADIHEVDGRPLARKGKIPGITSTPRLDRVM